VRTANLMLACSVVTTSRIPIIPMIMIPMTLQTCQVTKFELNINEQSARTARSDGATIATRPTALTSDRTSLADLSEWLLLTQSGHQVRFWTKCFYLAG
jgi:hypothetical protein